MQQEFSIALGSRHGRWKIRTHVKPRIGGERSDPNYRVALLGGGAHNPALAYLSFPHLELGLDQHDQIHSSTLETWSPRRQFRLERVLQWEQDFRE